MAASDTKPGLEIAPPPTVRRDWVICGVLVVGVLLAFSPALSADFVRWDDPTFVTDNPHVRGITLENLEWMLTGNRGGHFHPLTWLSWAIDYELWGGYQPRGFHLTNILLHAVNSVLVYFLLRRLIAPGGKVGSGITSGSLAIAAGLGAALFALHPLRAESVAWITERRDVLSAAFLLGSLIAYLRSVRPGEARTANRRMYVLSFLLLVLSCMSKGWGMIFFAVLLVVDWYPLRRISIDPRAWFRRDTLLVVAQKLPFAILGVLTALMAAHASHVNNAVKTLDQWGVRERVVQAAYGLWFYTRATFFPDKLSPLYQLPVRIDPWEPRYVAAYCFIAVLVGGIVALRNRCPAISAAGLIYMIILSPVLGLLQSGEQFVADRYSYLASLVYSALIGAGFLALLGRPRPDGTEKGQPVRMLMYAGAGTLVVALSLLTAGQTFIWTSTESLWGSAVVAAPGSQVLVNYAMELDRQGRHEESIAAFVAAAKLNPTDGRAWFTLGNTLKDGGHPREAAAAFAQAARYLPQAYMAYVNLGGMYMQLDRPTDAIAAFRAAVADVERGGPRPLSAGPYVALGAALRKTGDAAGAREMLTKALAYDETRADAQKELNLLDHPPPDEKPPGSLVPEKKSPGG